MFRALIALALFALSTHCIAAAETGMPSLKVGDIEIVAIQDSPYIFSSAVFTNVDQAAIKQCMPEGTAPGTTTAFLLKLKNGEKILVDAGFSTLMGAKPELLQNLTRAGVKPEEIAAVLLTHMHSDHIGGLVENGKRVFPKAKIRCSKSEYVFWGNKESLEKILPKTDEGDVPFMKQQFNLVEQLIKVYGDDFLPPFEVGEKPIPSLPGLTAMNAVGHTPGHTTFMIESDGEKFMVVGDLLHAVALQFPYPEAYTRFDMNPEDTLKTRRHFLDKAAEENIPIGGMHFPSPNIGHVKRDGKTVTFSFLCSVAPMFYKKKPLW